LNEELRALRRRCDSFGLSGSWGWIREAMLLKACTATEFFMLRDKRRVWYAGVYVVRTACTRMCGVDVVHEYVWCGAAQCGAYGIYKYGWDEMGCMG
jgi:hypothetical protein